MAAEYSEKRPLVRSKAPLRHQSQPVLCGYVPRMPSIVKSHAGSHSNEQERNQHDLMYTLSLGYSLSPKAVPSPRRGNYCTASTLWSPMDYAYKYIAGKMSERFRLTVYHDPRNVPFSSPRQVPLSFPKPPRSPRSRQYRRQDSAPPCVLLFGRRGRSEAVASASPTSACRCKNGNGETEKGSDKEGKARRKTTGPMLTPSPA